MLGPGTPPEGIGSLKLGVGAANQATLMTNPLLNELFPPTLTFFHPFSGLTARGQRTYQPETLFTATSVRFEAYANGRAAPLATT